MTSMISDMIRISPLDNVGVALRPIAPQSILPVEGGHIVAAEAIPQGHKIALRPIAAGEAVLRYGAPIGHASRTIAAGSHVHSHNLATALSGEDAYRFDPRPASRAGVEPGRTFRGYCRADGVVGTRNEIWILPTVGCVARTAEKVANIAAERHRGRIDGVHALTHPFGCSQLGDDLQNTAAILAALARHPNAGGVLLLGLGCESNQLTALYERLPAERRSRIRMLGAQRSNDEVADALAAIDELAEIAADDQRSEVGLDALRLGLKCGGSDGFSGLTANPLIGRMADAVTQAGGSAVLTEIPEIFGAERLLMARCADRECFDGLVNLVNGFKRYFLDHGEPVSENPSPGNIAGGITTLEEKSLGAVQKGGQAEVTDILRYGERLRRPGLTILEAPGNDAVSTTALAASGVTMTLFSTGRGTPLGSPVPTLKLASNSALAEHKGRWIDFDAGIVLRDGFETAADMLLDLIVDTASGAPARNERNDERGIAIWKRGVTL